MDSLAAIAELHERHGHIQEVILQNFVPHQRYYGQEPAEIADEAAREYWRTGVAEGRPELPLPRVGVSGRDRGHEAADRRGAAPDARRRHPDPAQPRRLVGRARRRGRDRPRRTVCERRSHLARAPVPLALIRCAASCSATATRSPSASASTPSTSTRSGSPRGCSTRSRRGTGRSSRAAAPVVPSRPPPIAPSLVPGAIERARDGRALTEQELTAMFAETRPQAIEEMRIAADELRAELAGETVTFVVNRNVNISNVCTVGCAFCGFGQGKRSPDAYEHDAEEFVGTAARRARLRRHRDLHPVGDPPGLVARGLPGLAAACEGDRARGRRRSAPARVQPDGDRAHVRHLRAAAGRGLRPPARRRPRLDAGHGRRGAARRRAPADLAEQAARRALGRDHRGLPRRRAALDLDRDVRPHRGALGAGRAHARRARAAGTDRRHHRVRAAVVHPLPDPARAHARRRGDLARGEPQAHGRLPPGARPDDPQRAGQLGEDGPRRGHRGAALGRQRPRRHADGGVDQPARRQLPRRQARPRSARRRRPRGRAPGGRAHDAVRDPQALPRPRPGGGEWAVEAAAAV